MSRTFLDALQTAVERLESCGVRYMLTGAVAVQAWGTPRLTFDADVEALFASPEQQACFDRGLFLEEEGVDILGQRTRIYHVPTNPVYIEVFVASHPYVLRALGRRRKVSVPGLLKDPAWFIAPEDAIVMKALHAAHPSRPRAKAAQDRLDIASIVRSQGPSLDRGLVRSEASALGIAGDLDRWAAEG